MTIKPQKASIIKAKTASEESEHQTARTTQQIQSEVEESSKKNAGAKKSAQEQHDAQPEVARPQGLNETKYPAQKPEREDAVPGRRKSSEFSFSISDAALAQIQSHRKASDHLTNVQDASYARIYEAERLLCGHIVSIGNPPSIANTNWWSPFEVDGRSYVLEPRAPSPGANAKVRVYELMPSHGPAPGGNDVPPQLRRMHRDAPPDYIGPRRRSRNRSDTDGARAGSAKPKAPEQKKRKRKSESERIVTELYNLNPTLLELKLLSQKLACSALQSWRTRKPRLLRNLVEMRRFSRSCGTALHDLRNLRDAVASVVRSSLVSRVFSISVSKSATRKQRELVSETFGPSGRLEPSDAGYIVSKRIRLNSWSWDAPPLPRADDTCGGLWPLTWFGAREEEVFT